MKDLRAHFPILGKKIDGKDLIYFDSAATTQRPQEMLDVLMEFYTSYNANIHRVIYSIGERATYEYEQSRVKVAHFIGAQDLSEIVFVGGCTEGINLVAATWGASEIASGDEILLTELEHHANLLPWQLLAYHTGATLKFIPVLSDGTIDMAMLPELVTENTRLVSIIHSSNVLGTHVDIKTITQAAHAVGARVLVDAAQSVAHQRVDVKEIGCDFLVLSGHKMLGPTGIGVLYIKKDLHQMIPPYHVGGGMVFEADYHQSSWLPMPQKLEAGTPAIAQAIGLGAAIDFLNKYINFDDLKKYEALLCSRLINGLQHFPQVRILGSLEELKRSGHVVSFTIEGIHPHDIAAYLGNHGICVRAGHHCVQPLAKKLDIQASVRASFYFYNTLQEVDFFLDVIKQLLIDLL